jgi:uncharacterized protein YjiS (DUF1127 family)
MTMICNTPCLVTTASVRRRFAILFARLGRLMHRMVAVMIARRERQAALVALRHLNRRKRKDIGIYRYQIGEVPPETAAARKRQQPQHSLANPLGGNEPTVGVDRMAVKILPSRSRESSQI